MNVSEIIAEWLKANQYDGLMDAETGCRCKVVEPKNGRTNLTAGEHDR